MSSRRFTTAHDRKIPTFWGRQLTTTNEFVGINIISEEQNVIGLDIFPVVRNWGQKAEVSHLYGLRDIDCEENQERQAIILIHILRLERVVSYRDQEERGRSLMPEVFLYSQNVSASWMIRYPRLLSDTLKDTGLIKNVRGGIGCQYFDRKESRLSALETGSH